MVVLEAELCVAVDFNGSHWDVFNILPPLFVFRINITMLLTKSLRPFGTWPSLSLSLWLNFHTYSPLFTHTVSDCVRCVISWHIYACAFSRWVCEEIPDLKLAMENYVLIDYDTKRWAKGHDEICLCHWRWKFPNLWRLGHSECQHFHPANCWSNSVPVHLNRRVCF